MNKESSEPNQLPLKPTHRDKLSLTRILRWQTLMGLKALRGDLPKVPWIPQKLAQRLQSPQDL